MRTGAASEGVEVEIGAEVRRALQTVACPAYGGCECT
jgi:hypothetical protein